MPAFITVIFILAVIVRVLHNKYRIHQSIDWRNYRKIAVQLLWISAFSMLLLLSQAVSRKVATYYYGENDLLWI